VLGNAPLPTQQACDLYTGVLASTGACIEYQIVHTIDLGLDVSMQSIQQQQSGSLRIITGLTYLARKLRICRIQILEQIDFRDTVNPHPIFQPDHISLFLSANSSVSADSAILPHTPSDHTAYIEQSMAHTEVVRPPDCSPFDPVSAPA
jgi:hypothetical protein